MIIDSTLIMSIIAGALGALIVLASGRSKKRAPTKRKVKRRPKLTSTYRMENGTRIEPRKNTANP